MTNRMNRFASSRCLAPKSAAALAAGIFASLILSPLLAVDSATAAPKMSECQRKHSLCTERCIVRYGTGKKGIEQADACILRTCEKQNPGCGPSSLRSGGAKMIQTNPSGTTSGGVRAPFGIGILNKSPKPSNQGPGTPSGTIIR